MKKTLSILQTLLLMTVLIVIGAGFYVSVMVHHRLDASAAFYIGLPALIAIIIIMTEPSRNRMGATMKGITLALILSVPLLQEGFLCILFAAPLFYAVAAIIVFIVNSMLDDKPNNKTLRAWAPMLLLAVAAVEGTTEELSFKRDTVVTVEKVIATPAEQIATNLQQPAQFKKEVPLFLRIFPQPSNVIHEGDSQRMHFVYYKHIWFSANAGDVVFKVTDQSDRHIHTDVISDTSYLHNYMDWQSSRVEWDAIDAGHTRVRWSIRYKRKLDPAWYFGPMEEYAVHKVAEMLIENAATPKGSNI